MHFHASWWEGTLFPLLPLKTVNPFYGLLDLGGAFTRRCSKVREKQTTCDKQKGALCSDSVGDSILGSPLDMCFQPYQLGMRVRVCVEWPCGCSTTFLPAHQFRTGFGVILNAYSKPVALMNSFFCTRFFQPASTQNRQAVAEMTEDAAGSTCCCGRVSEAVPLSFFSSFQYA